VAYRWKGEQVVGEEVCWWTHNPLSLRAWTSSGVRGVKSIELWTEGSGSMESGTSSYSSSSSSRDRVMSLSAALSSSGGLYAGSAMLKQVC
jgi:hypothetical protein